MIDLFSKTNGDKKNKPLMFLHGFMGSSDDWQPLMNELSDDSYTIAFDLPGHGQTEASDDNDYSMPTCAEAIIKWMNTHAIKQSSLCGYSMGGRLAFYLAVHYPDRFDKVIIESASPGLQNESERKERKQIDHMRSNRLLMEDLGGFINDWYAMPLFQTINKQSERYHQMIARRKKNSPEKLARSLRYMGVGEQSSLWKELPNIKMPMYLIIGEKDKKFKQISSDVNKTNQDINIIEISSAGHNVHFEQEQKYIETIKNILNSEV